MARDHADEYAIRKLKKPPDWKAIYALRKARGTLNKKPRLREYKDRRERNHLMTLAIPNDLWDELKIFTDRSRQTFTAAILEFIEWGLEDRQ